MKTPREGEVIPFTLTDGVGLPRPHHHHQERENHMATKLSRQGRRVIDLETRREMRTFYEKEAAQEKAEKLKTGGDRG